MAFRFMTVQTSMYPLSQSQCKFTYWYAQLKEQFLVGFGRPCFFPVNYSRSRPPFPSHRDKSGRPFCTTFPCLVAAAKLFMCTQSALHGINHDAETDHGTDEKGPWNKTMCQCQTTSPKVEQTPFKTGFKSKQTEQSFRIFWCSVHTRRKSQQRNLTVRFRLHRFHF